MSSEKGTSEWKERKRRHGASAPERQLEGSYIDWPAILGGAVVAVALASVFTGFGAALGLSTVSLEAGKGSGTFTFILSAIWIGATLVASYMAGGYIAGRMRRRVDKAGAEEVTARDGINGLVVWGFGIVASVFLLGAAASTTVSALGSAASAVGSVAGTVATSAGSVVGGLAEGALSAAGAMVPEEVTEDPMAYVNDTLLRQGPGQAGTTAPDPVSLARETTAILGNVLKTGEINDAERAYLVGAVVARTGMTEAQAQARVDEAVATAQQTRADAMQLAADTRAEAERIAAEAKEAALQAAEVARISAILTAFILAAAALVAGAAAYIGAVRGGRHRDEGRIFRGFAYSG